MTITHKHEGIEYTLEFDLLNGEVEIWRDDARVDIIDLTDLLAGYSNNAKARAQDAIEQNYRMYRTSEHNWFIPEEDRP